METSFLLKIPTDGASDYLLNRKQYVFSDNVKSYGENVKCGVL